MRARSQSSLFGVRHRRHVITTLPIHLLRWLVTTGIIYAVFGRCRTIIISSHVFIRRFTGFSLRIITITGSDGRFKRRYFFCSTVGRTSFRHMRASVFTRKYYSINGRALSIYYPESQGNALTDTPQSLYNNNNNNVFNIFRVYVRSCGDKSV